MGRDQDRDPLRRAAPAGRPIPWPAAGLLGVLLVATALAGCTSSPDGPDGTQAPDFSVTTIDDGEFTLSKQEGKVVLLYFMGVGCSSCAWNLPHHKQLWETHGDDPRFQMIALNSWATHGISGESKEDMQEYRDREAIEWPLAPAPVSAVDDYNVRGTPTHVFIDAEGRIRGTGNTMTFGELDAKIQPLLDEQPV